MVGARRTESVPSLRSGLRAEALSHDPAGPGDLRRLALLVALSDRPGGARPFRIRNSGCPLTAVRGSGCRYSVRPFVRRSQQHRKQGPAFNHPVDDDKLVGGMGPAADSTQTIQSGGVEAGDVAVRTAT